MKSFGYTGAQWKEIFLGLLHGVNVSKYAKKKYSASIMKELREGLEEGIDVTIYSGKRSVERIRLMKEAIRKNIDISKFMYNNYCGFDFTSDLKTVINASENGININQLFESNYQLNQVLVICEASNNGVLVMPYINPKMPYTLIKLIYKCMEANINVSYFSTIKDYGCFVADIHHSDYESVINWHKSGFDIIDYIKRGFNLRQIEQIFLGWQLKIDTIKYTDVKFDWSQMEEIRKGEETGINTSIYANPDFSKEQMAIIRDGLEAGIDVTLFANPEIDITRMIDIKNRLINVKSNNQRETQDTVNEPVPEANRRNRRSAKYNNQE